MNETAQLASGVQFIDVVFYVQLYILFSTKLQKIIR